MSGPKPEFVKMAHGLRKLMPPALGAVMWYIFAQKDALLAEAFCTSLASGTNMQETDPVFILRERLIKGRGQRMRPKPEHLWEFVVRAWTATRKDERLTKLQRGRKELGKGVPAPRRLSI